MWKFQGVAAWSTWHPGGVCVEGELLRRWKMKESTCQPWVPPSAHLEMIVRSQQRQRMGRRRRWRDFCAGTSHAEWHQMDGYSRKFTGVNPFIHAAHTLIQFRVKPFSCIYCIGKKTHFIISSVCYLLPCWFDVAPNLNLSFTQTKLRNAKTVFHCNKWIHTSLWGNFGCGVRDTKLLGLLTHLLSSILRTSKHKLDPGLRSREY